MSLADYLRFAGALLVVLGLILAAAWLYRKLAGTGGGRPLLGGGRTRRLSVSESLPLDASRRLLLIRRDDTEHLILVGQDRAMVVETGIPAPPPAEPTRPVRRRDAPPTNGPALQAVPNASAPSVAPTVVPATAPGPNAGPRPVGGGADGTQQ